MKIEIDNASQKQLVNFAKVHLGLEVDGRSSPDKVRALMAQAGYSASTIDVDDVEEAPTKVAVAQASADAKRKRMMIMIPNQEAPGGREPVLVGVNGRVARIQRGVPVPVPEEYVHALQNANVANYNTGPNGELLDMTMVPTHPFSIIGPA